LKTREVAEFTHEINFQTGYIRDQEKHHAKISFRDEFIALLQKHRIEFDEKLLWK
jgi:putative transposase